MKKLVVLVLLLIGGASYYLTRPAEDVGSAPTLKKISSPNKSLFLGKKKKLNSSNPTLANADSCHKLTNQLSDLDLSLEPEDWLREVDMKLLDGCETQAERIKLIKEHCFSKKMSPECGMHMVFLRSVLRTDGKENSEDREELADLIIREFSKKNEINFKNVKKFSEKLLDLDPSNQALQKMWAMSKLLSQNDLQKLPKDLYDDIFNRLDPEIRDTRDMRSLELIMKSELNPQKLEDLTRSMMKGDKSDPQLYEILGWSLWRQGRREEALNQLSSAMNLNPQDPWLKEMVQKLKSPGADENTYQARLNLGIRLEDLF